MNYLCTLFLYLYSRVVNAFEGKIASAVENAISKKIREGIIKLDSLLQSIPKEIPVYHTAVLNVTFVDNPVLSNSSIEFEINGLVTAKDAVLVSNYNHKGWKDIFFGRDPAKMIQISLQQDVFNSVSLVYFDVSSFNVNSCFPHYYSSAFKRILFLL
jgi:lipopolysaccharide-binding protein